MKHGDAVKLVRYEMSQTGALIVPYTVGKFRTLDGKRVVSVGRSGVADTLACREGQYIAVEVKSTDTDKQNVDQEKYQAAVERAGGIYIIADFRFGRDGLEEIRKFSSC